MNELLISYVFAAFSGFKLYTLNTTGRLFQRQTSNEISLAFLLEKFQVKSYKIYKLRAMQTVLIAS